jgi:preprotein translocase subunit SecD
VVIFIAATATRHTPPATSQTSTGSARSPSRFVSITLSPTTSASADVLAAAAQLLRQRAARLHLQYAQAQVSGQNVVLTGPAADETRLKTLATTGVLDMRQVLLYGPATSTAGSSTTSGDPSLVQQNVRALFGKLICKPGDTTQWKAQVGYNITSTYDNPDVQVVACGNDSGGQGKYVLDVAKVQGTQVTSAAATLAKTSSQWEVNLSLNSGGAAAFSALTSHLSHTYYPTASTNQNNAVLDEIAIVVDGNVVTAPVIQGAVPGGKVQITGNFTRDYAQELAAQLQSGRLPVNFRISAISIFAPSASSQAPAN